MKNRRYAVVVMDSSGRHVRRFHVERRWLEATILSASLGAFIFVVMTVHGLWMRRDAQEAVEIGRENREIAKIIKQLESRLPEARSLSLYTELSFSQLWAKSGLGTESIMANGANNPNSPGLAGSDLLNTEPISLPLELDRIEEEGMSLQGSLGDTLEYFHDADLLLSNTPSVRPCKTPWLTSSFGKRKDPIFGFWVMHKGLDMGGHLGQLIRAPADGVVIWVGRRGGYGQTVVVDHGYGLQTHYAHLSKYLVSVGDHVRRGDSLAEMGSTGKSTGPHLHYEVRRFGQPMDPRRFILD